MSTLRITTLATQDGTYSVPSETLSRAACRAWVNFNGTGTVAIRASYNVSSITDNDTGDYTVNFTNVMADVNYCPNVSVWNTTNGTSDTYTGLRAVVGQIKGTSGISTSAVGVETTTTSTEDFAVSRVDFSGVFVTIFR